MSSSSLNRGAASRTSQIYSQTSSGELPSNVFRRLSASAGPSGSSTPGDSRGSTNSLRGGVSAYHPRPHLTTASVHASIANTNPSTNVRPSPLLSKQGGSATTSALPSSANLGRRPQPGSAGGSLPGRTGSAGNPNGRRPPSGPTQSSPTDASSGSLDTVDDYLTSSAARTVMHGSGSRTGSSGSRPRSQGTGNDSYSLVEQNSHQDIQDDNDEAIGSSGNYTSTSNNNSGSGLTAEERRLQQLLEAERAMFAEHARVETENAKLRAELNELIEDRKTKRNRVLQEIADKINGITDDMLQLEKEQKMVDQKKKDFYKELGWNPNAKPGSRLRWNAPSLKSLPNLTASTPSSPSSTSASSTTTTSQPRITFDSSSTKPIPPSTSTPTSSTTSNNNNNKTSTTGLNASLRAMTLTTTSTTNRTPSPTSTPSTGSPTYSMTTQSSSPITPSSSSSLSLSLSSSSSLSSSQIRKQIGGKANEPGPSKSKINQSTPPMTNSNSSSNNNNNNSNPSRNSTSNNNDSKDNNNNDNDNNDNNNNSHDDNDNNNDDDGDDVWDRGFNLLHGRDELSDYDTDAEHDQDNMNLGDPSYIKFKQREYERKKREKELLDRLHKEHYDNDLKHAQDQE